MMDSPLQAFVKACFQWADSEAARTGASPRLASLVVSDKLGYLARAGREIAADTPPIDPQGDIGHHTGLAFAAAATLAAVMLRDRFPANAPGAGIILPDDPLPPGVPPA